MKKILRKSNNPNGRPKSANPKTANLGDVRLAKEEKESLKSRAKGLGLSFTEFIRGRLGLETNVGKG